MSWLTKQLQPFGKAVTLVAAYAARVLRAGEKTIPVNDDAFAFRPKRSGCRIDQDFDLRVSIEAVCNVRQAQVQQFQQFGAVVVVVFDVRQLAIWTPTQGAQILLAVRPASIVWPSGMQHAPCG